LQAKANIAASYELGVLLRLLIFLLSLFLFSQEHSVKSSGKYQNATPPSPTQNRQGKEELGISD
jgi:hypothetical protein